MQQQQQSVVEKSQKKKQSRMIVCGCALEKAHAGRYVGSYEYANARAKLHLPMIVFKGYRTCVPMRCTVHASIQPKTSTTTTITSGIGRSGNNIL